MTIHASEGVAEFLKWVSGEEFPGLDEDRLFAIAEEYTTASNAMVNELAPLIVASVEAIRATFDGDAERAYADEMAKFVNAEPKYLYVAAEQLAAAAESTRETGTQVEYVKIVIILSIVELMAELASAIAMAVFFPGLNGWIAAKIAATRFKVHWILSKLITLLIQLAMSVITSVAFQVGMDLLAQSIQMMRGTRDSIDGNLTKQAAGVGVVSGFVGLGVGAAAGAMFKKFVPVREIVSGAASEYLSEGTYNWIAEGKFDASLASLSAGAISGGLGVTGEHIGEKIGASHPELAKFPVQTESVPDSASDPGGSADSGSKSGGSGGSADSGSESGGSDDAGGSGEKDDSKNGSDQDPVVVPGSTDDVEQTLLTSVDPAPGAPARVGDGSFTGQTTDAGQPSDAGAGNGDQATAGDTTGAGAASSQTAADTGTGTSKPSAAGDSASTASESASSAPAVSVAAPSSSTSTAPATAQSTAPQSATTPSAATDSSTPQTATPGPTTSESVTADPATPTEQVAQAGQDAVVQEDGGPDPAWSETAVVSDDVGQAPAQAVVGQDGSGQGPVQVVGGAGHVGQAPGQAVVAPERSAALSDAARANLAEAPPRNAQQVSSRMLGFAGTLRTVTTAADCYSVLLGLHLRGYGRLAATTVDTGIVETADPKVFATAVNGQWTPVGREQDLLTAVRDAGPGATAYLDVSPPGQPRHVFALHHDADTGGLVWIDPMAGPAGSARAEVRPVGGPAPTSLAGARMLVVGFDDGAPVVPQAVTISPDLTTGVPSALLTESLLLAAATVTPGQNGSPRTAAPVPPSPAPAPAALTEPETVASEPEATATEPETVTTEPEATATEPETAVGEAGADAAEAGAGGGEGDGSGRGVSESGPGGRIRRAVDDVLVRVAGLHAELAALTSTEDTPGAEVSASVQSRLAEAARETAAQAATYQALADRYASARTLATEAATALDTLDVDAAYEAAAGRAKLLERSDLQAVARKLGRARDAAVGQVDDALAEQVRNWAGQDETTRQTAQAAAEALTGLADWLSAASPRSWVDVGDAGRLGVLLGEADGVPLKDLPGWTLPVHLADSTALGLSEVQFADGFARAAEQQMRSLVRDWEIAQGGTAAGLDLAVQQVTEALNSRHRLDNLLGSGDRMTVRVPKTGAAAELVVTLTLDDFAEAPAQQGAKTLTRIDKAVTSSKTGGSATQTASGVNLSAGLPLIVPVGPGVLTVSGGVSVPLRQVATSIGNGTTVTTHRQSRPDTDAGALTAQATLTISLVHEGGTSSRTETAPALVTAAKLMLTAAPATESAFELSPAHVGEGARTSALWEALTGIDALAPLTEVGSRSREQLWQAVSAVSVTAAVETFLPATASGDDGLTLVLTSDDGKQSRSLTITAVPGDASVLGSTDDVTLRVSTQETSTVSQTSATTGGMSAGFQAGYGADPFYARIQGSWSRGWSRTQSAALGSSAAHKQTVVVVGETRLLQVPVSWTITYEGATQPTSVPVSGGDYLLIRQSADSLTTPEGIERSVPLPPTMLGGTSLGNAAVLSVSKLADIRAAVLRVLGDAPAGSPPPRMSLRLGVSRRSVDPRLLTSDVINSPGMRAQFESLLGEGLVVRRTVRTKGHNITTTVRVRFRPDGELLIIGSSRTLSLRHTRTAGRDSSRVVANTRSTQRRFGVGARTHPGGTTTHTGVAVQSGRSDTQRTGTTAARYRAVLIQTAKSAGDGPTIYETRFRGTVSVTGSERSRPRRALKVISGGQAKTRTRSLTTTDVENVDARLLVPAAELTGTPGPATTPGTRTVLPPRTYGVAIDTSTVVETAVTLLRDVDGSGRQLDDASTARAQIARFLDAGQLLGRLTDPSGTTETIGPLTWRGLLHRYNVALSVTTRVDGISVAYDSALPGMEMEAATGDSASVVAAQSQSRTRQVTVGGDVVAEGHGVRHVGGAEAGYVLSATGTGTSRGISGGIERNVVHKGEFVYYRLDVTLELSATGNGRFLAADVQRQQTVRTTAVVAVSLADVLAFNAQAEGTMIAPLPLPDGDLTIGRPVDAGRATAAPWVLPSFLQNSMSHTILDSTIDTTALLQEFRTALSEAGITALTSQYLNDPLRNHSRAEQQLSGENVLAQLDSALNGGFLVVLSESERVLLVGRSFTGLTIEVTATLSDVVFQRVNNDDTELELYAKGGVQGGSDSSDGRGVTASASYGSGVSRDVIDPVQRAGGVLSATSGQTVNRTTANSASATSEQVSTSTGLQVRMTGTLTVTFTAHGRNLPATGVSRTGIFEDFAFRVSEELTEVSPPAAGPGTAAPAPLPDTEVTPRALERWLGGGVALPPGSLLLSSTDATQTVQAFTEALGRYQDGRLLSESRSLVPAALNTLASPSVTRAHAHELTRHGRSQQASGSALFSRAQVSLGRYLRLGTPRLDRVIEGFRTEHPSAASRTSTTGDSIGNTQNTDLAGHFGGDLKGETLQQLHGAVGTMAPNMTAAMQGTGSSTGMNHKYRGRTLLFTVPVSERVVVRGDDGTVGGQVDHPPVTVQVNEHEATQAGWLPPNLDTAMDAWADSVQARSVWETHGRNDSADEAQALLDDAELQQLTGEDAVLRGESADLHSRRDSSAATERALGEELHRSAVLRDEHVATVTEAERLAREAQEAVDAAVVALKDADPAEREQKVAGLRAAAETAERDAATRREEQATLEALQQEALKEFRAQADETERLQSAAEAKEAEIRAVRDRHATRTAEIIQGRQAEHARLQDTYIASRREATTAIRALAPATTAKTVTAPPPQAPGPATKSRKPNFLRDIRQPAVSSPSWSAMREWAPVGTVVSETVDAAAAAPVTSGDAVADTLAAIANPVSRGHTRFDVRRMEVSPGIWVSEYTVKLRLDPRHSTMDASAWTTDAQIQDLQERLTRLVDTEVNGRYRLPGGDRFHLVLDFTATDPHAVIAVHQGTHGTDQLTWHADDPASVLLHESLHFLGLRDEYSAADSLFRSRQDFTDSGGVMGSAARSAVPLLTEENLRIIEETTAANAVLHDATPATEHSWRARPPAVHESPAPAERSVSADEAPPPAAQVDGHRALVEAQATALTGLDTLYIAPEQFDAAGNVIDGNPLALAGPQQGIDTLLIRDRDWPTPYTATRSAPLRSEWEGTFHSRYFTYRIQMVNAQAGLGLPHPTGVDPGAAFAIVGRYPRQLGGGPGRTFRHAERWEPRPGQELEALALAQRLGFRNEDRFSSSVQFRPLPEIDSYPLRFYIETAHADPSFVGPDGHTVIRHDSMDSAVFDDHVSRSPAFDPGGPFTSAFGYYVMTNPGTSAHPLIFRADAQSQNQVMGGSASEAVGSAGRRGSTGTLASHEWIHLLGYGDGGQNAANNLAIGTNAVNTEQLALEIALRGFRPRAYGVGWEIHITPTALVMPVPFNGRVVGQAHWVSYQVDLLNPATGATRFAFRQIMDANRGVITEYEFHYLMDWAKRGLEEAFANLP
ncbi:MAG TPA: hypothetical protein VN408_03370 [Actinoplanes sp.]|nr:hypothetical protein [Actinoplanes sp.]